MTNASMSDWNRLTSSGVYRFTSPKSRNVTCPPGRNR